MAKINFKEKTLLYGLTPPKSSSLQEKITEIAKKTAVRINRLKPTAVVIYDIQDESKRNSSPRPFAFFQTISPIEYAKVLSKYITTPIILYNCVINQTKQELVEWLKETEEVENIDAVVFAGGQSSSEKTQKLTLNQAYEVFKEQNPNLQLGGITIAERHFKTKKEHLNILKKIEKGCKFFISQAVYNDDVSIWMLSDLRKQCLEDGIETPPIILTFAPCGNERTLEFMGWLGIFIPQTIKERILCSPEPTEESVEICYEKFLSIVHYCERFDMKVGANVESVSKIKKEIESAESLFNLFKTI